MRERERERERERDVLGNKTNRDDVLSDWNSSLPIGTAPCSPKILHLSSWCKWLFWRSYDLLGLLIFN